MKFKDISVALLVLGVIVIIIIAVPPIMLDMLLVINIATSLVLLLNTLYVKSALELSIFPSILLIMTIFRLALNISTTRLILGPTGEVGKMIEGFGNFVAGGSLGIGVVIFAIITIVQFMVITKGTERVSEVAARFTLDAMPGKQMAIDADLNSGLINEEEAKERRKNVQREADFYGAMDGATKFVKGDAIAGILITFINIIGGFIVGMMQRGMPWDKVLQTYTIYTIGDGLVSQVPALMISIATGIIVTRAASEGNLSDDFFSQIFNNYKVMFLGAGTCVVLAIPLTPLFLVMAAVLLIAGIGFRRKALKQAVITEEMQIESEIEEIKKPENAVLFLRIEPIEIELGYGIIPLVENGDLEDRLQVIRRRLASDYGIILPEIRLVDSIDLNPNEYVVKIKEEKVASGELMFDHYLAMNPGMVEEEIDGFKTVDPAFGIPAVWIRDNMKNKAEMLGYSVFDAPAIMCTHITEIFKKHANEFMGRKEVQKIIDNVKQENQIVVDEMLKSISIGQIQKVLSNLLKEGVSIKDAATIFETLSDYATITNEIDILTEYVRQALSRTITRLFINEERTNVITLDPKLEMEIQNHIHRDNVSGAFLSLDPNTTNTIINNLSKQVQRLTQMGEQPIILASPIVRFHFKRLCDQYIPGVVVLSYNEIDTGVNLQSVGMVSI